MSDLRAGPTLVTVGDIAALTDGPFGSNLKTAHYVAEGPRVVRLQNIGDGVFREERAHITEEHFNSLRKHEVVPGDVVVASLGEEAPRACLVPEWLGPAVVKADCIRLRPAQGIDSGFVMWMLNSPPVRAQAGASIKGVGRPRLGLGGLKKLELPLPPLNEQRKIVAAIEEQFSRLDAADASLAAARARFATLRPQIVRQGLEGEWNELLIGEVADVISGPAFQSASFGGPDEGIRLLRGENIEPGGLRWRDTRTWPTSQLSGHEHLLVEESDLILAMDRPVISTGLKLAPVRHEDLPALLVQRVARLRPRDLIETRFLHLCLQLPRFIPHVLGDQTGTQIPHITLAGIREFLVPVPPIDEQRRIVARMEEQLSVMDALRAAIERAQRRSASLRRAVLDRAFRGDLVPQDSTDEPVETLLAPASARSER